MNVSGNKLEQQELPVGIRGQLAALWTSVTLCYLYCDYFELYQPGKLQSMLAGRMGPLGESSQVVLLGASVMLSVPALMVFLSVFLSASNARRANVVAGALYTLIMLVFVFSPGIWFYYRYFAVLEVILTATAVWLAVKWPKNGLHLPTK